MVFWTEEDIENGVFNRKCGLFNLKIPFAQHEPFEKTITIDCKHKKKRIFILDSCDNGERFVIHPESKLQISNLGGIISIRRLRENETMEFEYLESLKKPSVDFGLTVLGNGLNISSDREKEQIFKTHLDKLTHEHLILEINGNKKHTKDIIEFNIKYINIGIEEETMVRDQINNIKKRLAIRDLERFKDTHNLL